MLTPVAASISGLELIGRNDISLEAERLMARMKRRLFREIQPSLYLRQRPSKVESRVMAETYQKLAAETTGIKQSRRK